MRTAAGTFVKSFVERQSANGLVKRAGRVRNYRRRRKDLTMCRVVSVVSSSSRAP